MNPDKLSPTLRERKFSSVFWRFVNDEKDIRGLIAYGLYKFHKIHYVVNNGIKSRNDERLDHFDPLPDTIADCRRRADQFLLETNATISTETVGSIQSDQLSRIERLLNKSFLPNVHSSFWGSVAFVVVGALIIPFVLWLMNPDLRPSIEREAARFLAGLSNQQAVAINALINDLEDQQRHQLLVTMIDRAVAESPQPMDVLRAVFDGFDRRSIDDGVVEEIVAIALKRSQNPGAMLQTIFWQELQRIESAAPPIYEATQEP